MRRAATEATAGPPARSGSAGGSVHEARKEVQRLERAFEALAAQMAACASDHTRLGVLRFELDALLAEREGLEETWLDTAATLESGAES